MELAEYESRVKTAAGEAWDTELGALPKRNSSRKRSLCETEPLLLGRNTVAEARLA